MMKKVSLVQHFFFSSQCTSIVNINGRNHYTVNISDKNSYMCWCLWIHLCPYNPINACMYICAHICACMFCDCMFDTFIHTHKRCTKAMCIFSKLLDENLARQMAIFPRSNTLSLLCFKKSIKT